IRAEREVAIVCAGKLGGFSLEDAACAGLLIARLEAHGAVEADAPARFVRGLAPADAAEARAVVEGAAHARDLRAMGEAYRRDLELCATLDAVDRAYDLGASTAPP